MRISTSGRIQHGGGGREVSQWPEVGHVDGRQGSHITVVVASESHELQTCAHVASAVTTAIGGLRSVNSPVRRPP